MQKVAIEVVSSWDYACMHRLYIIQGCMVNLAWYKNYRSQGVAEKDTTLYDYSSSLTH